MRNYWIRYFYFTMSLVIAAVVIYGFSHTINENLIHPAYPRPVVLYVHAAIFAGWVVLLITQSAFIRTRNVRLHRKLGLCALALAIALPIIGIATGVAMARFNTQHGSTDATEFLIVRSLISFFHNCCWPRNRVAEETGIPPTANVSRHLRAYDSRIQSISSEYRARQLGLCRR